MKRVAILIRSLANGGAEKQALLLALALKATHEVEVLVVSPEPCFPRHVDFAARHGLRVDFLGGNPVSKLFALARRLRRDRVSVLFTFLPSDTLLGGLAGRWAGVPCIVGGLRNTGLRRDKVLALRFLHNHVFDATISNSRAAALHFEEQGFVGSKLLVIPNGIEVRAAPTAREHGDGLSILTVARFVPKKDIRTALRAVARAKRALGGAVALCYRIVGYGPLEERIRSWIRDEGLEHDVELAIDPPSVDPFYAQADLYLSSSRHEGLSNAILEAMNHGLPIVATTAGDSEVLVGAAGILAEPGDWKTLGDGLVRLAQDGEARLSMGARAHRRVLEHYSVEALGAAYRAVIEHGTSPRAGTPETLPAPGRAGDS